MRRTQGRVTGDDIRSAGLRRWDGRARVTTDWINLFHEPELCWPTGDCLVYLREPGQSSRGPAFRVHTAFLKVKGFETLVDRCLTRNSIHAEAQCVLPNCPGCDPQQTLLELYIPAPHGAGLEDIFDYHVTTRNFFAWLYNRPLAGRALGKALADLKARIDVYRPDDTSQNALEVVSYAEQQKYLDFRECVDHALAALYLAETLQIQDLWVDAFAHCVGMSHRGLRSSIEYEVTSTKSKALINRARLEMDLRLDRVYKSVVDFFESEVRVGFLGLPQPARDHLFKFRAFLRKFYVDKHLCWPPDGFESDATRQKIYSAIFSDFKNLYQHLVDPESSTSLGESDVTKSGGICTHQVIQAFDIKHRYEPLAHPLPLLPKGPDSAAGQRQPLQRRLSWNPIQKRKADREARKMQDKQALITASNRDLLVMDCPLVRRFSEFEESTVDDELVGLSVIEGRKVRWLMVYAVLQTFHAIAQPPVQVRNTNNLTYSLCCQPPKRMPWQLTPVPDVRSVGRVSSQLIPDTSYSHTNALKSSTGEGMVRGRSAKARRRTTLPAHLPGSLKASLTSKTPPGSRSSSLRRLISRRAQSVVDEMPSKRPAFCEIFVEGYGNGLNEVNAEKAAPGAMELAAEQDVVEHPIQEERNEPHELVGDSVHELASDEIKAPPPLPPSDGSATTPVSMSRESSAASIASNWSKTSDKSDLGPTTPTSDAVCSLKEILHTTSSAKDLKSVTKQTSQSLVHNATDSTTIVDDEEDDPMQMPSVHFNTQTWDMILGQIPVSESPREPSTAPAGVAAAAPLVARA
ncbi:hypothetical protein A1O3_09468 [Capronia epimyces CBS 606.96]|uniref:DUF8004 domain-containing protein n=1 Tax=Capronia epimyces CBS 606.96 TaxID=1182542 RepID=W9XCU2_9EURO|nr:uncharacterized protein A1O3_09468 [Capronia epimyces CBS 606.96]EXJ78307.1 hypothetical protein A1O3_09468 [Capronia epimyces CBS 606.96]